MIEYIGNYSDSRDTVRSVYLCDTEANSRLYLRESDRSGTIQAHPWSISHQRFSEGLELLAPLFVTSEAFSHLKDWSKYIGQTLNEVVLAIKLGK